MPPTASDMLARHLSGVAFAVAVVSLLVLLSDSSDDRWTFGIGGVIGIAIGLGIIIARAGRRCSGGGS